jgi:hypothetical protein
LDAIGGSGNAHASAAHIPVRRQPEVAGVDEHPQRVVARRRFEEPQALNLCACQAKAWQLVVFRPNQPDQVGHARRDGWCFESLHESVPTVYRRVRGSTETPIVARRILLPWITLQPCCQKRLTDHSLARRLLFFRGTHEPRHCDAQDGTVSDTR